MAEEEYKKACKELFDKHATKKDAENSTPHSEEEKAPKSDEAALDIDQFKNFTLECTKEAGMKDEDQKEMKESETNEEKGMWQVMFKTWDKNDNKCIAWTECIEFLLKNKP